MRRRRWNRAGEHPALRAFRAIEDAYYRVTAARRASVVRRVRAALGRHLAPDHPVLRDFDAQQAGYSPLSLSNIAAGQGVRYLWPWEWVTHACRSAWICEFMVSQWICLCWPSWSHRWALVPLALGMRGWRQHGATVDAQVWVPRYLAPMVGAVPQVESVAVNRRGVGWWRVGWWQWRPDPVPALVVDLTPLVVGLVLVLALAWPSVASAGVSLAALSAGTVWEVRTTGNAANAGGFNPSGSSPGTDYSQQDAPQVIIDGATITATVNATTTLLDISGYTVAATDNRNLVRIAGGTMTAGTYEITAVDTGNNRWTLDRSGGTAGQTGTGRMGGAQSDPALVAALLVAGNIVYQKSGTYSITSASTNVAGGCISTSTRHVMEGYQTTRGDLGTKPVNQASGISSATLFTIGNAQSVMINVKWDGASLTTLRGLNIGQPFICRLVDVVNCTNSGIIGSAATNVIRCYVSGCTTTGQATYRGLLLSSVVEANSVIGINESTAVFSVSSGNTGAGTDGVGAGGSNGAFCVNVVSYGNGRDGFGNALNSHSMSYVNCIAEGNGRYGFNAGSGTGIGLSNCATNNNTSGATNGTFVYNVNSVTGTGSFFTNAAAGDFTLNNTAGAGAAARAAGIPGAFPGISTTGYLDIGAAQHQDSASGGVAPIAAFAYTGISSS